MTVVLSKIVIIFAMIIVGFVACKLGVLPAASREYLVNMLIQITTPCLIISSMASGEVGGSMMRMAIEVLIVSLGYFIVIPIIMLLFGKLLRHTPDSDKGVLMGAMTAVNSGFMGFPITKAIFGDKIFFLMVMQNVMLNVYVYFIALFQINIGQKTKKSFKDTLKASLNMSTIATLIGLVLMFTGTTLPSPVMEFFGTIGDATVPISMIIVGIQLAGSDLRKVITNPDLVFTSIINIVIVPIITFLLVNWLPIADASKLTVIFSAAFPCAVAFAAVVSREGKNADIAAQCVALTTAMSLVSLPIVATILQHLYL